MPVIDQLDVPEQIEYVNAPSSGMVSETESQLLTREEAAYLENADLSKPGTRYRAPGVRPITCLPNSAIIGGFGISKAYNKYLVVANKNLYFCPYGGSWANIGSSGLSFIDSTFYSGFGFGSRFYFFPYYEIGASCTYHGVSIVGDPVVGVGTVNGIIKYLTRAFGRLWGCRDDALWWNNVAAPYNFPDGASGKLISFSDNDPLRSVLPLREQTPRLLIFRQNSIWLLDIYWDQEGYQATSSNLLDFTKAQIRPIVDEAGSVGPLAACWVPGMSGPGDFLFMSYDGIRSLNRSLTDVQSGLGLPLSRKIQPLIDQINWPNADCVSSYYYKGKAYFNVPLGTATIPSACIVYDTVRNAFSVSSIAPFLMSTYAPPLLEPRLYFVMASTTTETYPDSTQYKQHIFQHNVAQSEYGAGLKTPGGGAHPYIEETRGLTFDTIAIPGSGIDHLKRWRETHLLINPDPGTGASLLLSYKLDDATSWTEFRSINVPAGSTPLRFDLSLCSLRPGYKLQWRLEDSWSYSHWKITDWVTSALPLNRIFAR